MSRTGPRRLTRTIDERAGDSPAPASTRRAFLTRAATGGAVALTATAVPAAVLAPTAWAQGEGSTPGSSVGASGSAGSTPPGTDATGVTTGEGNPPKLEGADLTITAYAISLELAVIAAYDEIIGTHQLSPPVEFNANQFKLHHQGHWAALVAWVGTESPTQANTTLAKELTAKVAAANDEKALARVAYELETRMAATYAAMLGELEGWEIAGLVSTIEPIGAEQALAWSQTVEPDVAVWATDITEWIPNFQTDNDAYRPASYPAS